MDMAFILAIDQLREDLVGLSRVVLDQGAKIKLLEEDAKARNLARMNSAALIKHMGKEEGKL